MITNHIDTFRRDPEFRWELVERVRREIKEGVYDTPEKMDIALEFLLLRLQGEELPD